MFVMLAELIDSTSSRAVFRVLGIGRVYVSTSVQVMRKPKTLRQLYSQSEPGHVGDETSGSVSVSHLGCCYVKSHPEYSCTSSWIRSDVGFLDYRSVPG